MRHHVFPAMLALALACTGAQTTQPVQPKGGVEGDPRTEAHLHEPNQPMPTPGPGEVPATPPQSTSPAAAMDTATLRLEGTPEVPSALRERMNQYLNTRSAFVANVSAKGDALLVSTRFGEVNQTHLVRMPMGARTQLTFLEEPVNAALFDPRDPDAILYVADIGGNEQDQFYRLDLETGRSIRLTDPEARNVSPVWSKDGSRLAYSSTSRNKRDFDIWLMDGRNPASAERIVDARGMWSPIDWSFDGKKLLVGEYISINESRLHVVDVATRQVTQLSPKDAMSAYPDAVLARDGKTVYATSDREGEFVEIYETDLTGSSWRSLTRSIPWDVEDMELSPDGRTLAFTVNQGGYGTLHLLDTRTRKITEVKDIPKGLVNGLDFAQDANVLGLNFMSSTQSSDAYTFDLKRRKLVRWTQSELGGLSSKNLVEPTLIEYKTFDGKTIPAFYYQPKGQGPFPVIISIHGGPEGQSRPYFAPLTQYLVADSGIAVLYPNVRGSAGYGKSYLMLDNGKQREDSVKDIGALLDWIATRPELDAKRVGVLGGSYGGYMVLATLTHYSERIVAGVDIVGISNFITFLENTAEYRRDLRRVEYGDERDPEMRAFLEKISPLSNVQKIKSALFVAQGANDPRVPASEAEQIVAAVRRAGHDVWYMLAKNEGHGFAKKDNRDLYSLLTVLFFEKHLGVMK